MAMNRTQYLLTKLAEECNEVAQRALKTQQFGLDESYQGRTNREMLHEELNDLVTIISMLNKESNLNFIPDDLSINEKEFNVNEYYKYSLSLGMVK